MTRLLVVRHALAASADDLRLPGPDVALLPEGVAQARALAERLRQFVPAAVYASEARRAWQTGEIIAAACQCELHRSAALREFDFGDWGGQTFASVVAADSSAADWFADPTVGAPPGGESGAEAATRVLTFFGEIAGVCPQPPRTPSPPTPSPVEPGEGAFGRVNRKDQGTPPPVCRRAGRGGIGREKISLTGSTHPDSASGAESVVVVGHAGSLRLALAQALGMPLAAYWRLRLDCASLSILTWTDAGPSVDSLNDVSHLAALGAEKARPSAEGIS